MSAKRRQVLLVSAISVTVILTGIGYAVYSTFRTGTALEYYKRVHEVTASLHQWEAYRLRVHGNVVKGTIQKKPASAEYRFALFSQDQWIDVTYRGLVPDTFKDCAEVVVTGSLNANTKTLTANHITAKCPSKYDQQARQTTCGEPLLKSVQSYRQRATISRAY